MATDPSKYLFNHTMLRIKEPKRSLDYYKSIGMTLIHEMPVEAAKFTNYFLAYDTPETAGEHFTARQGVLELCHNWGSEEDPNFSVVNGNTEPHKGFGHICVSVDNIQAACTRLEDQGYKFQKKLSDGRMRNIAFALDPDGYWVEIIGQNDFKETEDVKETDLSNYRLNHSMIRVKDPKKSLEFYQDVMGMDLLRTSENPDNKFNLYFLGYSAIKAPTQAHREGVLELTWNYGTENDAEFKYHDGNKEPQGFGHIGFSVDNLDAACKRMEEKGVEWQKKRTDGRMKNIAFAKDPDGYWVEIFQNQKYGDSGL